MPRDIKPYDIKAKHPWHDPDKPWWAQPGRFVKDTPLVVGKDKFHPRDYSAMFARTPGLYDKAKGYDQRFLSRWIKQTGGKEGVGPGGAYVWEEGDLPGKDRMRLARITNPNWPGPPGPQKYTSSTQKVAKAAETQGKMPEKIQMMHVDPPQEKPLHRKSLKILERLMDRAGMEVPEGAEEQREWYQWFMNKRNLSQAKKLMRKFEAEDRERSDRFQLLEQGLEAKYQGIEPGKLYTRADLMKKRGTGGSWKIRAEHQDKMFYNPITGMRMEGDRDQQAAFLDILNKQSAAAAMERYALMAEEATVREAEASSGMDLTGNPSLDSIIANRKMQQSSEARADRDHALALLRESRAQETHDVAMTEHQRRVSDEEAAAETMRAIAKAKGAGDPVIDTLINGLKKGYGPRAAGLLLEHAGREQEYGRDLEKEMRTREFDWQRILMDQDLQLGEEARQAAGKSRDELQKHLTANNAWQISTSMKQAAGINVLDKNVDLNSFFRSAEPKQILHVAKTLQDTANLIEQQVGVYGDYLTRAMIMWDKIGLPPEVMETMAETQASYQREVDDLQGGIARLLMQSTTGEEGEEVDRKQLRTVLLMARDLNEGLEQGMRGVLGSFSRAANVPMR